MTRRRLAALVVALTLALPVTAQDAALVLTERVVDRADLLSPSVEQVLSDLLLAHENATTNQVAVLTVPSLQGESIESFSLRVAEATGLGTAEADNGVLLVVAVEERGVRIEVGYGLEGILPDALAGRIIRDGIVPHFRSGDFEQGIQAGVTAVLNRLEAPSTEALDAPTTPTYAAPSPVSLYPFRSGLDRFTLVLGAFYAALLVLGMAVAALNVLAEMPKRIIFFLLLAPVFYAAGRSLFALLLGPFLPFDLWRFGGIAGVTLYAAAFWGIVYHFSGMDERMVTWRRYFRASAASKKKRKKGKKRPQRLVQYTASAAVVVMAGAGAYLGWVPVLWLIVGIVLALYVLFKLSPPGAFASSGGSSSGSSYRSSGWSSSSSSSSSYSSSSSSSSYSSSSSSGSSFSGGGGSFGGGGASGSW